MLAIVNVIADFPDPIGYKGLGLPPGRVCVPIHRVPSCVGFLKPLGEGLIACELPDPNLFGSFRQRKISKQGLFLGPCSPVKEAEGK